MLSVLFQAFGLMIRRSLLMTHRRHYCNMAMFIMLRKKMLATLILIADIGAHIDNNAYLEVEMCVLYLGLFRHLAHFIFNSRVLWRTGAKD